MVARGIHSKGGNSDWAIKNIAGKNKAQLTGERFGRLLVVGECGRNKHGAVLWKCLCDCGGENVVTTNRLRVERVQSCGCLSRERASQNIRKRHADAKTHGLGHGNYSPTYKTWLSMRDRAKHHTTGASAYDGITICDRWDSFELFLQDMGERPEGKTLDRINPRGNYEPANCRWATMKEQQRNRRNTVYIDVNGVRVAATEFAEEFGLNKGDIYSYLKVKKILEKNG